MLGSSCPWWCPHLVRQLLFILPETHFIKLSKGKWHLHSKSFNWSLSAEMWNRELFGTNFLTKSSEWFDKSLSHKSQTHPLPTSAWQEEEESSSSSTPWNPLHLFSKVTHKYSHPNTIQLCLTCGKKFKTYSLCKCNNTCASSYAKAKIQMGTKWKTAVLFPGAAATNLCTSGGLQQQKYIPWAQEAGSLETRCQQSNAPSEGSRENLPCLFQFLVA